MPAERRRIMRAVLSVVLVLLGVLIAVTTDRSTLYETAPEISTSMFDDPSFSIRLGRNQLQLVGTTVSVEHEAALLQLAAEQFADTNTKTEFKSALELTHDWEAVSTRLLYLVAATDSAHAVMDTGSIVIRGTAQNEAKYEKRLEFLHAAITTDKQIDSDVLVVSNTSIEMLCYRAFENLNTHKISFHQSSTDIKTSSYPLLDKLAEFAYECHTQRIVIRGHSDATGDAAWNLQISRLRAQAVADHLIQNGVAAERLIVNGFGSSLPIADNDTVHGRERNRRIEIELR
ncbi:MAG: OmpA family protein [Woeseiaceae bacterium]